jgi:hypothetical protein
MHIPFLLPDGSAGSPLAHPEDERSITVVLDTCPEQSIDEYSFIVSDEAEQEAYLELLPELRML